MPTNPIANMKAKWNHLAAINAEHFIESSKDSWDIDEFACSGQADVDKFLMPLLAQNHMLPAALSVLDFGCGIGRLSQALARHFRSVTAIDISDEMIRKGKVVFGHLTNIQWHSYDGYDLSAIPSRSHDVVFSYIVLQHVADENTALHYIKELCRITAPNGLLRVQFSHRSLYRARKLYCRVRARLAQNDLIYHTVLKQWGRRRYGRDELINMLSIMQHSISPARVRQVAEEAGMHLIDIDTRNPAYCWLTARRPA